MSRPIVEVEKLSKRYRLGVVGATTLRDDISRFTRKLRSEQAPTDISEFWALRDVSFSVQPGEVVGIIGRNGAGKSTLLKILSRITEPTSGRVTLRGRVASLLEVGTGFHSDLTGRENVFLNGAILGMKRAEIVAKFDEIVAFAEVEKFIDTPVKHYSSGMTVRLAFAVAAHLDPEILIIDEVLAVGDASFQKKCLSKIGDVAKCGRTILFVSHNAVAIRSLCSRGVVLENGRVAVCGSAAAALNYYNAHTALASGLTWIRSASSDLPGIYFSRTQVQLDGHQPRQRLHCDLFLECRKAQGDCLLAIDICDQSLVPVMQAVPDSSPFIKTIIGSHQIRVTVELPPLIPGFYCIDLWLGRHFSETIDYLRNVVAFEITESPTTGRTFPHTADHGFIVPPSCYEYSPPSNNCISTPR